MGTWILIKDGIVQNRIVAEAQDILNIKSSYDECLEVDGSRVAATVGWIKTDNSYEPPKEIPPDLKILSTNIQENYDAIKQAMEKVSDPLLNSPEMIQLKDALVAIENKINPTVPVIPDKP